MVHHSCLGRITLHYIGDTTRVAVSMDTVRKYKKTVVKSMRYQQCRRQKKSPTRKNPQDPSLLASLLASLGL